MWLTIALCKVKSESLRSEISSRSSAGKSLSLRSYPFKMILFDLVDYTSIRGALFLDLGGPFGRQLQSDQDIFICSQICPLLI